MTAKRGAATPQPVSFEVEASRVGSAVVLNIVGIGRSQVEGQPFEDPTTWSIECSAGGHQLQRVVNGSARIERAPVGPVEANLWDVTVRYTVGFAVPAHVGAIEVGIEAPGAQVFAREVSLEVASL